MTDENLTPASEEAQGGAPDEPQTDADSSDASTADTPEAADAVETADAPAGESVSIDFSSDTSGQADAEPAAASEISPVTAGASEADAAEADAAATVDVTTYDATATEGIFTDAGIDAAPAIDDAPAPAAPIAAAAPPAPAPRHSKPPRTPAVELPFKLGDEGGPEAQSSMEQVTDHYSRTFTSLNEGDVIQGVVVHIDREGVLVDVGTKSEGIIRRNELSRDTSIPAEDIVQVGQTIDVYVMEAENQDGNLILSKKLADFEKAWEKVQEAKEDNRTLQAMVTDRVKGGLVVDLGIREFVPASHVGNGSMKNNLERYVGQSIPLKVIEVDKERRKVVLSNKMAQEEERASKKQETVGSLQVGQIRRGTVRRLTNYGAFVDLGGIDGLLHISEMSWTRINHPQEVLKEGQELDVLILKMDLEAGRVSLGLRQILPDPWTDIGDHYSVGDVITGQVSRVVPFGIFVQIDGGIEGIIPNAELSARKGGKSAPMPAQGEDVEVKIADLRPEERKMTLSLRGGRVEEETKRERQDVDEFEPRQTDREEPRFTIGDALRAKEEAADDDDDDLDDEDDEDEVELEQE